MLVRRILHLIRDEGYSIDRMLVVTYTRAAAAEGVLGRRSRDIGELKGAIKSGVSNYLFKTTKRSPMVIPVITKL